ncbi:MAG: hypothetical protein EHM13_11315 [Acidobacteria bacterium]|nr:MAG: hypothetical protein EHM13_11315 [Acidobacteriota bacterium]
MADLPFQSPLVEMFRRGEVPDDVRLMAAKGALAPRANEQLALLVILASDRHPVINQEAEKTLDRLPAPTVAAFLARSDAGEEVRAFFKARGIEPAPAPAEGDQPLLDTEEGQPGPAEDGDEGQGRPRLLASLPVTERIKVALRGRREERAILVRDPNRLVSSAVLRSPRLTDDEVETFARMANVSEDVLRIIGGTRTWTRKHPIALALARNPKTPLAVSLPLIPLLQEREVKQITTDRNLPEGLRLQARKFVLAGESRKR